MIKSKLVGIVAGLALTASVCAQTSGIDDAKQLFAEYVALESAYDPGLADLYADDAFIKSRRNYPMGGARDTTVAAPNYKAQIRRSMPVAQARGDRKTYSEVTYTPEGELIRIRAVRFTEPKKTASPMMLLVGPSRGGKWLIYEELSESPQ